ncbi:hypothetical protein UFOVP276_101 [uncultured Caudovirales phage]|uniref:Uncharacterized protein n=1 Tax=uncultured Caudovirales phage TaxID=2100421 RepID=A0A6J5LLK1_9CAUD|nr:hypothetical protein UFOVP127_238 [uncultured Caudovirales phage]CAB4135145.1 hypothetical protein UFOVP276_101 [uncultured Caudovirales phage]
MGVTLELGIRYIGFGLACNHCGQVRETTRYVLINAQTDDIIQDFRLCDQCQDNGHVIKFDIKYANPLIAKRAARRIQLSRGMERGLAIDVGGKVQPGSGNQDDKDDVRVQGEWRFEHKYTDSVKSYKLEACDLDAVARHAKLSGEKPALVLNFRKLAKRYVTLPYDLFLELMEKLK